jgi:hypothetical protein
MASSALTVVFGFILRSRRVLENLPVLCLAGIVMGFALALIGTHRAGGVVRLGTPTGELKRLECRYDWNPGKFCWLKLNSQDGECRETPLFNLPDAGYDLVDLLDRAILDRELDTANAVGAATISARPAVEFSGPVSSSHDLPPGSPVRLECRAVRAGYGRAQWAIKPASTFRTKSWASCGERGSARGVSMLFPP